MESETARCFTHNKHSFMYCKTCKRMLCLKCHDCQRHCIQSVHEFLLENKESTDADSFNLYRPLVPELLRNNKAATKAIREKIRRLETTKLEIRSTKSKSEHNEKNDISLVDKAISYLRDTGEKAVTKVLQRAIQEAVEVLDIDDEIAGEISGYHDQITKIKDKIKSHKEKTRAFAVEREWLDKINSTIPDGEVDEDSKLALALCFANNIIERKPATQQCHEVNDSSHVSEVVEPDMLYKPPDYSAFDGVSGIFNFERVKSQSTIDIGFGVMVSKPVKFGSGLRGGQDIHASLSHRGILAIHSNTPNDTVQFTDLLEGRRVEVGVEFSTLVGFYDDSLIMLTCNKPLRISTVEAMFNVQNVAVLRQVNNEDVVCKSDVSLLNSRRTLVYRSTSFALFEYYVDSKESRELFIGKKVWSLATSTGIDIGIKGVFYENGNGDPTNILNKNNSTTLALEYDPGSIITTFIPSTSCPNDFNKALKIYADGSCFINGTNSVLLNRPVMYQAYYSIIRLYQDIFLVYDGGNRSWCIVRIIVH